MTLEIIGEVEFFFPFASSCIFGGGGRGEAMRIYPHPCTHTLGEPVKIMWSWFHWGIVKLRTSAS